ncbi:MULTISPECIES: asparagine synthase C-terminal domain-containing protein [unclassified Phenylobacterium]|uniref:asparagine synthase-related protein n=1 Tax=unclassified Phenylobacterium TaxID=2640670 RepID=UPI00083A64ED|nr:MULTISPECIES: asparagine synthase C-terminal domain-containing protein [unclassified Phenylobacterium]
MKRAGYLALTWPRGAELARARAEQIAHILADTGDWRLSYAHADLRVWTATRDPPGVKAHMGGGGVTIGAVYPMPGRPVSQGVACAEPLANARQISRAHWGRFVALLPEPQGAGVWVYRDPSGGMAAFAWSLGDGLEAVSSELNGFPLGIGPRRPFLNWCAIAELIAKPAVCATQVLVEDVVAIQPGECFKLGDDKVAEVIWSPADFGDDPIDDSMSAADGLRERVDLCTSTLIGGYDRALLEVSGGLDSAILAGALHQGGLTGRISEAVNIAFGRPESDEQSYARAVASRAGIPLTERRHHPEALDLADLEDLAGEFRPSANGVDPKWDRDEIERAHATGSRAIVSGQGGDALFMQMSTPGLMADAWRRDGWSALRGPLLGDVARRTRRSVWAVLRDARAEGRGRAALSEELWSSLISPEVRAATRDLKPTWERQAEARGLPPGKRLHIHALARFLLNEGPSRRRREVDVLYPLFAQPVVEHALRIPAPVLAGSSYDRAYARSVFADRLPDIVVKRRAKGIVTVYFAKLIAASLPALRPYLLEGCLAEAGVLDRARLERALAPEHLIWAAKPSDILWAVATEAWVRHWQKQVPDSLTAPRGV